MPIYNEHLILAEVLEKYKADLTAVAKDLGASWEIIAVNDGSDDGSKEILLSVAKMTRSLRIVNLAGRFGKQAAITAGMEAASGDVVVLVDVDLLNPVGVIGRVMQEYMAGEEIVYAYREHLRGERLKLGASDRLAAFAAKIFGVQGEYMSKANIMLFSRATADVIRALPNKNKYLRAMDNWVGFEIKVIVYPSGYNKDEIRDKVRAAKALDKQQGLPNLGRSTAREHTPSKIYGFVCLLLTLFFVGLTVGLSFTGMHILVNVIWAIIILGMATLTIMLFARSIMIKRIGVVHLKFDDPIYEVENVIN